MRRAKQDKNNLTALSFSSVIRHYKKIVIILAVIALIAGLSFISPLLYHKSSSSQNQQLAFSATDKNAIDKENQSDITVSRGADRSPLPLEKDKNLNFVNVRINGRQKVVVGRNLRTVKDVLEAADITLEPHDSVVPSLNSAVTEATVVQITSPKAHVETSDESIPFNVVTRETPSLPQGTKKVQTEGKTGVMETTRLVVRNNTTVISSNIFESVVKQAPVDKIILVGTGKKAVDMPNVTIGQTAPVGEIQQWAHDYLLSHGYTEEDFTATVFIISHESGWRVNAMNPSGAYGLPQALPGRKMASAGADWATNYQTQLRWFWNYCANRYGSIQGAYRYWLSHHNY